VVEKLEVGVEKVNHDAVEKSQSESKTFDAIDVGHWAGAPLEELTALPRPGSIKVGRLHKAHFM